MPTLDTKQREKWPAPHPYPKPSELEAELETAREEAMSDPLRAKARAVLALLRAAGIMILRYSSGGAAHLAGVIAAQTLVPVLGVPMESQSLKGLDSLLSMVQMPGGIPVGTLAIGKAGATNAALLAVAILANTRPHLREKLRQFREEQAQKVLNETLP